MVEIKLTSRRFRSVQQSILFAAIRSVLIWLGLIIVLNRKQKWSVFTLYITLTLIFTYYSFLFIDQLTHPALFIFAFMMSSLRKDGWIAESRRNFFHLSLVFMILIWAHSIANMVSRLVKTVYEINDGYLLQGGTHYLGTYSVTTFGLLVNIAVALACFLIVRMALKKSKVLRFIEQIDADYSKMLMIGTGIILLGYYTVIFFPEMLGFDCSGRTYLEAIYVTILVFLTGGLIQLFSAIVNKEMILIRRNATLIHINAELANKQTEIVQKEALIATLDHKMMDIDHVQRQLRDFEHGQRELLVALVGVIESDNKEALCELLEQYDVKIQNIVKDEPVFPDLQQLAAPELISVRYLLNSKATEAAEKSVKFTVEISAKILDIGMPVLEFIDILGIWLNNAIEEAVYTEEKRIHVSFILDENPEGPTILETRVTNSCRENALNPMLITEQGVTTKGEGHGNGLRIVNEKLMKHDNIYVSTRISGGQFMQLLEIVFDESKIQNSEV